MCLGRNSPYSNTLCRGQYTQIYPGTPIKGKNHCCTYTGGWKLHPEELECCSKAVARMGFLYLSVCLALTLQFQKSIPSPWEILAICFFQHWRLTEDKQTMEKQEKVRSIERRRHLHPNLLSSTSQTHRHIFYQKQNSKLRILRIGSSTINIMIF